MTQQLRRSQYRVTMFDPTAPADAAADVEHIVTVIHGDQIRGEQAARGRKLPPLDVAPIEHASLWVHAAMRRLQLTELPYGEWVDAVAELETVKGESGDPELATSDPTAASTD